MSVNFDTNWLSEKCFSCYGKRALPPLKLANGKHGCWADQ